MEIEELFQMDNTASKRMSVRKRNTVQPEDILTMNYFRKERQELPLKKKIKILEMLEKEPSTSQRIVANTFKVSQSQISRIQNNREKIVKALQSGNSERKRNRKGKGGLIELKLLEWYKEAVTTGLPISGSTMMEKAKSIGDELNLKFVPTIGWFSRWKNRNGITLKRTKSQEGVTSFGKISSHWRRHTFARVAKDNFENIWFLDSLNLFTNALPQDLDSSPVTLRGKMCVTVAFNYFGTQRRIPWIVGAERVSSDYSPMNYHHHPNAVISEDLFTKWLLDWDLHLKAERRRISLFLRRGAHVPETLHLHSIALYYFPDGAVDDLRLEPFHFGVSAAFKTLFRSQVAVLSRAHSACDRLAHPAKLCAGHFCALSVRDRLHLLRRAWSHVHPDVFVKGVVRVGLGKQVQALDIKEDVAPPPGMSADQFERFVLIDDTVSDNPSTEDDGGDEEIDDADALLACYVLRKYFQGRENPLLEKLAEIESGVAVHVSEKRDPSWDCNSWIDPLFNSASMHSKENHSKSVVRLNDCPANAASNDKDSRQVNISTAANGREERHVGKYPQPSFSTPTDGAPPHAPECREASARGGGSGQAVHQYSTTTAYIPQGMELKPMDPRAISDGVDRFTAIHHHAELQPRTINEMNPHIISAAPLPAQGQTFIAFAPQF